MKAYPTIEFSTSLPEKAHVFDKIDGSNLRFEWSRKAGWYKSGTRTRLFDETDTIFGGAKPLFLSSLGEPIERIAVDNRLERIIVFTEFSGPNSFAGLHDKNDQKTLRLFDVNVHKRGILGPKEFLRLFGHLDITTFLGVHTWGPQLLDQVRNGQLPGVTFEGVVGKCGSGHSLQMAKVKSQVWIDKVHAKFGSRASEYI